MANSFVYKDKTIQVGNTVSVSYLFKEGDKERKQIFKGMIVKVKGNSPVTKMITVRKISHSGVGVERIIPLASPFLTDITVDKKTSPHRAKLYFVRGLPEHKIRARVK